MKIFLNLLKYLIRKFLVSDDHNYILPEFSDEKEFTGQNAKFIEI